MKNTLYIKKTLTHKKRKVVLISLSHTGKGPMLQNNKDGEQPRSINTWNFANQGTSFFSSLEIKMGTSTSIVSIFILEETSVQYHY